MQSISLKSLAEKIGATLHLSGDDNEDTQINSLGTLAGAGIGQISFLSNSKYRNQLADTTAQAVILHPDELSHCPSTALVHTNPYVGFALAAQALDTTPDAASGIAASAVIAEDAVLGTGVSIGPNAVIESGVVLGDHVQVGAGCFIGKNCQIGSYTKLWANVSLYHNTIMGEQCLVQSATVIGSDGFGYANDKGRWIKIPQLGKVVIGNRVEIGASTTIDRGALEDTIIADGVIIDNQVQLAHNVHLGENTAMAACSVIAGSTKLGRNCSIAGLCGINGHIDICDNVHFTGMSMVTKSISEAGVYSSGMPAVSNREWRKNAVYLRQISSIADRVKALEKQHSK
ncbi:UDP-3-O-(3-hydroxymyristoyl)glucosamine N-acyltransferase [Aliiglaciecola sp. LCG003]|uniref:UDP-3-O-(3-hydroxymyristoyl)glucosamine N-acyltransferase n=1 Tax=Aliiglaciecola sp. LCG003 TaxID=3053655 RepID=UPI00257445C5|nr:UDP-3-O-(3-hydroxymyristoyl)glucosamine N-acyltransferase [Aliiglaciecola sp. LCG003]WJG08526.1 UDP-3-O-(3-hydroxymyristoyl)glucosamine N-acyltransferase [Aliiglaciecola sp. LCG003]